MSKEPKKYTKGFTDIEMLQEHFNSLEKQARRAEWLKANMKASSKDGKEPDVKTDA